MTNPPSGELVRTAEGDALVVTRTFRAPIEDVWASVTEPDRTARWFGTWKGDAAAGTKILSSRHDSNDNDLADGLGECITKSGKTQPTADIPMAGKRIINLGTPAASSDAGGASGAGARVSTLCEAAGGSAKWATL